MSSGTDGLTPECAHESLQFARLPVRLASRFNLDARMASGYQHAGAEPHRGRQIGHRVQQREVGVAVWRYRDDVERIAVTEVGPRAVAKNEQPSPDALRWTDARVRARTTHRGSIDTVSSNNHCRQVARLTHGAITRGLTNRARTRLIDRGCCRGAHQALFERAPGNDIGLMHEIGCVLGQNPVAERELLQPVHQLTRLAVEANLARARAALASGPELLDVTRIIVFAIGDCRRKLLLAPIPLSMNRYRPFPS